MYSVSKVLYVRKGTVSAAINVHTVLVYEYGLAGKKTMKKPACLPAWKQGTAVY
jgi:hypothetical protein